MSCYPAITPLSLFILFISWPSVCCPSITFQNQTFIYFHIFIYTCVYSVDICWVLMTCQIPWLNNEGLDLSILLDLGANLELFPLNPHRGKCRGHSLPYTYALSGHLKSPSLILDAYRDQEFWNLVTVEVFRWSENIWKHRCLETIERCYAVSCWHGPSPESHSRLQSSAQARAILTLCFLVIHTGAQFFIYFLPNLLITFDNMTGHYWIMLFHLQNGFCGCLLTKTLTFTNRKSSFSQLYFFQKWVSRAQF